jgi:hypothetical protein
MIRGNFERDLSSFVTETTANAEAVLRAVAVSILQQLVMRSPVDTGRFRGNWQVGLGKAAPGPVDTTDANAALAAAQSAVRPFTLGQTIFLANQLPYGPVLEFGLYPNPPKGGAGKTVGGFSKQAPAGMVGVTLRDFDAHVQRAARAVK